MPLDLNAFAMLRPYLYHWTSGQNLDSIRNGRILYSSATVLRTETTTARRDSDITAEVDGRRILVRDQRALHRGHVQLSGGWTWETLLNELNARVFFWPGTLDGAEEYGRRLARAYSATEQGALRISFEELIALNPDRPPFFCRFNSGGPRSVAGRKSPRGPDTFLRADQWTGRPSDVVEVSFAGAVRLPPSAELLFDDTWLRL
jgi:hypothetical protein